MYASVPEISPALHARAGALGRGFVSAQKVQLLAVDGPAALLPNEFHR